MKTILTLVIAFGFALAATAKPNVVLIMIDDFGYECVTANGGGSYKTPVMDQLAGSGVRFEQLHVQPLCTPTRVALMTGRINKHNYTHFGHLDPTQRTFGNLLRDAGYATCITGKWQLDNGLKGPAHFGFDEYCLWQLTRRPNRYKNPGLEINGKELDYSKNEYGPDLVNDYALDFIQRQKEKSFFLYYPMMLTHAPFDPTPDSADYTVSKGKEGKGSHFADMVAYADKLIGRLIAKIEELKLRENTIVLILGDNGTGKGTASRFQGRDVEGGKGSSTNWGTRVPGIGSWPGHFASGLVCRDIIDPSDFLPTICEVTGVNVPAALKVDGKSFLPQLMGEKGSPRQAHYVWYNPNGGAEAKFEFAHDADYKLYADGRFFNVATDDREKLPINEASLDEEAKSAKAELHSLLKQHEGPRDDYFVKQSQVMKSIGAEDAEAKKPVRVKAKPNTRSNKNSGSTRFTERDANHDGKISWEEFLESALAKDAAKQRFEMFDMDKDGKITLKEFNLQVRE
jgi:arylsulfatase A